MRKKDKNTIIKLGIISAIITAGGGILAAYYGGPLADTQWKERPIVEVSFGDLGQEHPNESLQIDDNYFYVDILARNRGSSDGKVVVFVTGENAMVNFDKSNNFEYTKSLRYTIQPNGNFTKLFPPIYVQPENNSIKFSIEMAVVDDSPKPINQELSAYKPTRLTFEKSDSGYSLTDWS